MLLPRRTLVRFDWLMLLSVFGIARPCFAQSADPSAAEETAALTAEPNPEEPDYPGSSPAATNSTQAASSASAPAVLPPTAAFPVEPERAQEQTPQATVGVAPAPARTPTAMPAKLPADNAAHFDTVSSNSSSDSSSTARSSSEPTEQTSPDEPSSRVIRLGPIVGLGLPNLLNIGAMLKLTSYLGAGVNVGLIPSVHIAYYGEATLAYQEYDVYGRIFPFGGGFFLGAGIGYATIKGTAKSTFDVSSYQAQAELAGISVPNPLTYQSEGSVRTMIITPQIGYFYTTDIGFSIGLDLGAQVPIAPSQVTYKSHLTLPAGTPPAVVSGIQSTYVTPNDKKVRDTLESIGRTPLPTFNIKIGWLF